MGSTASKHGFTLVEMLIVVLIIGIAAGMVLPQFGETAATKLTEAGRLLAADLNHAQVESISHGDDLRVVVFDTANATYHIAPTSDTSTPITNAIGGVPYTVTFGLGRAAPLTGVSIQSVSVGGDDELGFGKYGQLDQAADATVTLACEGSTLTVTIAATTGEVTVGGVN